MDPEMAMQIETLRKKFQEKGNDYKTKSRAAVTKACLVVERYAKQNMTPYGPSAPGEPPAVDTGRLRASITHAVEANASEAVGYVGTNVDYGAFLEFGTSKMSPRPWLTPSLQANKDEIQSIFKSELSGPVRSEGSGDE